MAQISYGTITITDTTDLENVFLIYKGSSSNTTAPSIIWSGDTNDWKTDITQVTGDYIWAITVFKYTGISITSSNYTKYYSDPVCLTGESGTSISITSIKYSTATTSSKPADSTFTLTNPPDVPEGEWLWSRTLFSSGQSVYSKAKQGQKGEQGEQGEQGERGISILKITTAPTTYTTTTGGFTPSYRVSLSTVKTQSGQSKVLVGDIIEYDSNHYRVGYIDSSYVYLGASTSIKGASGQSYYTYIRYADDANGTNMSSSPTGKTYIGVYAGTSSTAPSSASSYAPWMKYIGTDGQPGSSGVSVTQVRELYYLTTGNAPSKPTAQTTIYDYDVIAAWTSVVPEYINNGKYYISLETTLSNSTKVWSDVVLDQALTDANYNAAIANSISQSANENANGALSQASEANYKTDALDAKLKYFFYPGDSNYPGVYAVSGINNTPFNESNIATYGFNVALKPANVAIGYNTYKALELDGSIPALKLYKPSKISQGAQTAQLDSNGLVLSEGGIRSGSVNAGNSGFVYLSTKNYGSNLTINNHEASNWREVIGTKFGVDADGKLYASGATIKGNITVESGSNVYTKEELDKKFEPIASKTYTGLIGTANTQADASFYFAKVHPTDYNVLWSVKMRITVSVPNNPADYKQTIDITIDGQKNAFRSYNAYVARDGALSVYYVNLYRAKQAGIVTNHKGHALGVGFRNATNPTTAAYARTVTVDVLAVENCEVAMMDTAVKYANMDGTGSTNYDGLNELYVATNGQNATNNANSNYTQHGAVIAGHDGIKRYTLLMRDTPNTWVSFVNQANSTATNKTVITTGLMLGEILYHASASEYAETKASGTIYSMYPLDFRYSSNCGTTLVAYKPLYLVGTINANDGLFYLDTTQWWTQTLPSTEDGKTYVLVGTTYSNYQTYLEEKNPAYQFYDGEVRELESVEMLKQNKATFDVLDDRITSEVSAVETTSKSYTDGKISQEVTDRNSAITQKANEITQTVSETYVHGSDSRSGDIVTWKNMLIKDVVADIEPIQDLHGYDKPWSGGNGVNKWDEVTESGYINADGTEAVSATALRSKNYCPCVGGNTYYFHKPSSYTTTPNICWYDADKVFIERSTTSGFPLLTAPSNARFFRISMWNYGATYNHDIAINYPSTVTTYSPYSNICPISGRTEVVTSRCGVNVWDEEWEKGYLDPSTGGNASSNDCIRSKNYNAVLPNTSYYVKVPTSSGVNCKLYFYDENKSFISWTTKLNEAFTTPSNTRYLRFYMSNQYGTTYNHDISINYPSTDHDYHAYNGTSYTTDLGQTVYGGTLDVVSGVLTVDRISLKQSITSSSGSVLTNYRRVGINISANVANTAIRNTAICDIIGTYKEAYSEDSEHFYINNTGTTINVFVPKDYVGDVQVVYPIATPQTYQLTPQEVSALVGWNALWTNCDSVRVDLTGVKDFTDDVSELKITADGISTRVSSTETRISGTEARLSTAESTITQQATAIEAKVSKDGVIASINASVEEQGGSAVKISANKVNIEGAAIFTGSGRLSTTSLNNAYDAKGTAQTAVNGVQIGGRNLAPISHWYGGYARAVYTSNTANTYSTTARGFALCHTSDILAPLAPTSAGVGEEIAISFDFKIDSGGDASHAILFYPYQSNGISIADSFTLESNEKTTNWVRVKRITHARNFGDDGTNAIGCIYIYDNTGNNKFSVRNIKIERGNKATDFTPAPEDVKSVHTLMAPGGESQSSATYANIIGWCKEGTTQNWTVTSTAGVKKGDTVRVGYYVSNMGTAGNRPVVYCVGTVIDVLTSTRLSMTMHGLDTTIIDGGNIITNSIGANQIAANAITSDELAANAVTAEKIAANAIDTSKLTVGTQNDVLNSNVLVGGRNLFGYGSQCESLEGFNRAGTWDIRTEDGYVCAHASGALQTTFYLNSKIPFTPKPLEIMTFSLNVKIKNIVYGTTNPMCGLYFSGQTVDNTWRAWNILAVYVDGVKYEGSITNIRFPTYISDTKWHHFAVVAKAVNANFTANLSPFIYFRDATGDLYVRNIKYERGNKYTDWSSAPEDVEAFTEAFSSAKQISTYARSFTKANWDSYGASGHSESWSTSGYDNSHISVGDIAYINGSVSDKTGWYAAIIGKVTSVTTSAVVMTSIKVAYNSSQAEKYITKINDAGITIHPSGTTNDRIAINASGFEVWKGGTQRAAYGDTIRLKAPGGFPQICVDANEAWFAQASNTYATLNSNGFDIVRSGTSVAFYGDNARIGATTVGNKYVVITNSGLYVRKQVDASTTKDYLTLTDGWCCFGDPAASRITCNTTGDSPYFYMNAGGVNALYADSTGVKVGNYNENYSYIKSDGLHVYQSSTEVAFFGENARVGALNNSNIVVTPAGIIGNSSNNEYFDINSNGGQLTTTTYQPIIGASGSSAVTINLSNSSANYMWAAIANGGTFTISITYRYRITLSNNRYSYQQKTTAISFTKGTAKSHTYVTYDGANSITLTTAYPSMGGAFAGRNGVSLGKVDTTNTPFYRFGHEVAESGGAYGFLVGHGTTAGGNYQLACGTFNANNTNAYFIVGDGTSDTARSNAFVVDKSGNATVQNQISATNGSFSGYVNSALGYSVGGNLIGQVLTANIASAISMANNSGVQLCTLSIPAGTWIITGQITFDSNSSGIRRIAISPNTNADIATINAYAGMQTSAASAGQTVLNASYILTTSSTVSYYLYGLHNKGSALNATSAILKAVRIG